MFFKVEELKKEKAWLFSRKCGFSGKHYRLVQRTVQGGRLHYVSSAGFMGTMSHISESGWKKEKTYYEGDKMTIRF